MGDKKKRKEVEMEYWVWDRGMIVEKPEAEMNCEQCGTTVMTNPTGYCAECFAAGDAISARRRKMMKKR